MKSTASSGEDSRFPLWVSLSFSEGPAPCTAQKETDHKEVSVMDVCEVAINTGSECSKRNSPFDSAVS